MTKRPGPLADFYAKRGLLHRIDAMGELDAVTARLEAVLARVGKSAAPKRARARKAAKKAAKKVARKATSQPARKTAKKTVRKPAKKAAKKVARKPLVKPKSARQGARAQASGSEGAAPPLSAWLRCGGSAARPH